MPEATEDSSAATAWWEARTARTTVQLKTQGGRTFTALSVSRRLQRVVQREGYVSSANETTQRRTEHLWLTKERVEEERWKMLTKQQKATRLSAEEAAAEAAARVTAALDRWQAAETSRRASRGGQQDVGQGLNMAQRGSDKVLQNLLKGVEDSDNQVHSTTVRADSLVLGAHGWFRDFRQAMEGVIAGIAE